jgi:hypothetical protein
MRRAAVCALLVAACGGGETPLEVSLRVAPGDHPLAIADAVTLSLADADGHTLALRRATVSASSVELGAVPAGSGYVISLVASLGPDVVASGRSCAFNVRGGTPPAPVPLYFGRVGRFEPTGAPAASPEGAAAFSVGGGALLVAGAVSQRYDPSTGRFAPGPAPAASRSGALAVERSDGSALLIGGAQAGPGVEAFAGGTFSALPSTVPADLTDAAALALTDDVVLVAGGRSGGAVANAAYFVGGDREPSSPLVRRRADHTLTAAGTGRDALVVVVGGTGPDGPVADIELFDPFTRGFALAGAPLDTPRAHHSATLLPSGLVLVAGGLDAGGSPLAAAELFDPARRSTRPTGALGTARSGHSATLLPSGRVLVAGGVDASGAPTSSVEIYDPALPPDGAFVPTAPLGTPRAGHQVVPLCDGTLLLVGGGPGAERYVPAP